MPQRRGQDDSNPMDSSAMCHFHTSASKYTARAG